MSEHFVSLIILQRKTKCFRTTFFVRDDIPREKRLLLHFSLLWHRYRVCEEMWTCSNLHALDLEMGQERQLRQVEISLSEACINISLHYSY